MVGGQFKELGVKPWSGQAPDSLNQASTNITQDENAINYTHNMFLFVYLFFLLF